jgi:subtilisin-like proprotein convertase family protein
LGIVTTDRRGSQGYQSGDFTTIERFGGTSSSTPLVAGLCGLILSVNPNLTAEEVKTVLRETAVKIDPATGDYDANGHSRIFGWGRIDAFAALRRVQADMPGRPDVRVVSFESEPALSIPDRNPAGVTDSIPVSVAGSLQSVQVDVQITHTYRGDLSVDLVAPDGTAISLFGRGAPQIDSRDNLIATFSADNVPALTQLTGKNAAGNWALRVSDLAAADFGTLDKWVLRLGMEAIQTEWEATPGARIPDNNATGISSQIDVNSGGTLRDLTVTVDITHTYRGDLRLVLESPSGKNATLKSVNNQDGTDDLKQSYRPADTPALQVFLDEPIQGRWRLLVSDNLSADEGKLNSWSLRLLA